MPINIAEALPAGLRIRLVATFAGVPAASFVTLSVLTACNNVATVPATVWVPDGHAARLRTYRTRFPLAENPIRSASPDTRSTAAST